MILPESFKRFKKIYFVDFEYGSQPGERPEPRCMVVKEFFSGVTQKIWIKPGMPCPNAFADDDALYIAYFSSAEFGCHLALDWPLPKNILDLFVEFRRLTNGANLNRGNSLLAALAYFQIDGLPSAEKDDMRQLALRGGAYSEKEQSQLLDYCEKDVIAIEALLEKMLPVIDLPRALLRGRYMAASASMEHIGIPLDTFLLDKVKRHWTAIQEAMVA